MLDLKKQFSPLPWCCCCTAVVPLVPQGLLSSLTTNSPSQRPSEQRPSRLFATEGWEGEADVSDWEPFRLLGRSMVDYIADYYQGVESLPVRARVEPGYLKVERDIKRTAGRISRRTCAYICCMVYTACKGDDPCWLCIFAVNQEHAGELSTSFQRHDI